MVGKRTAEEWSGYGGQGKDCAEPTKEDWTLLKTGHFGDYHENRDEDSCCTYTSTVGALAIQVFETLNHHRSDIHCASKNKEFDVPSHGTEEGTDFEDDYTDQIDPFRWSDSHYLAPGQHQTSLLYTWAGA